MPNVLKLKINGKTASEWINDATYSVVDSKPVISSGGYQLIFKNNLLVISDHDGVLCVNDGDVDKLLMLHLS